MWAGCRKMAWGGAKPQATSGILRDNRTKQCWDVEKGACVERATCRGVTFEDHSQGRVTTQEASREQAPSSPPLSLICLCSRLSTTTGQRLARAPLKEGHCRKSGGMCEGRRRHPHKQHVQLPDHSSSVRLLLLTLCLPLRSVFGKIALYSKK